MNFVQTVCIVFELGDKMLTLSSMENLTVQCNRKRCYGRAENLSFVLNVVSLIDSKRRNVRKSCDFQ